MVLVLRQRRKFTRIKYSFISSEKNQNLMCLPWGGQSWRKSSVRLCSILAPPLVFHTIEHWAAEHMGLLDKHPAWSRSPERHCYCLPLNATQQPCCLAAINTYICNKAERQWDKQPIVTGKARKAARSTSVKIKSQGTALALFHRTISLPTLCVCVCACAQSQC